MKEPVKVFFPDLDGLRFIAFFAVFVNHGFSSVGFHKTNTTYNFIRYNFLQNGDLGVSFFFVLSGFLITYLLLKEKEMDGKINIINFYIRRVLRIWPVYFAVIIIGFVFIPLFYNRVPFHFPIGISVSNINPWLYVFFAGNFDYIFHGINNFLVGILWSVSIEEQFYLFWPLLIAFIPTKYLLSTFVVIIAGSVLFRYFYANGNAMIIKYHSLSCMSYLTTGAMIAYFATKEIFIAKIKHVPKRIIVFVYLLGMLIMPFRFYTWKFGIHYNLVSSFVPLIFAVFFAFIIIEQNYAEHSFYKMRKLKFISSLGKYTYGMYCYHMLVFFAVLFGLHLIGANIFGMDSYGFICIFVTSLFATILVSILSYHYFEIFFLKLKKIFS